MTRFLLFLLLITSLSSRAESISTESQENKPELKAEKGQQYRLVWKDGREAKLISETQAPVTSSVSLEYTKNTCAAVKAPRCEIRTRVQLQKIMYIWDKNPVFPDRIGKVLRTDKEDLSLDEGTFNENLYFENLFFITQYGQVLARELGLKSVGTPSLKDTIVCDHFKWLPRTDGNKIVVQSWLSQFEAAVPDFYTQGKEAPSFNQYVSGAKSIYLSQVSPVEVEVSYVELFNTSVKSFPTMALGYTTELSFDVSQYDNHPNKIPSDENYPNPTCKVQFTLNFGEILQNFNSLAVETKKGAYDASKAVDVLVDSSDPHQYLFRLNFEMTDMGY